MQVVYCVYCSGYKQLCTLAYMQMDNPVGCSELDICLERDLRVIE